MLVASVAYRYCSRMMFKCVWLVFVFLLGMHLLVELSHEISTLGIGRYDVITMLSYACLRLPADIYEFVPVGSMLGFIIALSTLAKRQELVIMRVSGLSLLRMGGWVLLNGALLIMTLMYAGETGIPYCSNTAREIKTKALSDGQMRITEYGIWLRSDQEVIHIGGVIDGKLQDVVCYHLSEDGGYLTKISRAKSGYRVPEGWRLVENQTTTFGKLTIKSGLTNDVILPINLSPQLLISTEIRTGEQNLNQLKDSIRYRHECGLNTRTQEMAWWLRVYSPLNAMFMILLSLPLVLSATDRRNDNSFKMLLGVILGFGFYMFHRMVGLIGLLHHTDVRIVAAIPTALSAAVCLCWLSRIK